tara:strand:- start:279 stop:791 length:513 start_codon:yes stop_codon:yes gene_type:complete
MTNTTLLADAARAFLGDPAKTLRTDQIEFCQPEDKRYRLDLCRRVAVYRNLQRNCWSVQQDSLVKAYAQDVVLEDCKWIVQPAGNRWVRENGRKKVHAFVRGYIRPVAIKSEYFSMAATYNPYKMRTFCLKSDSSVPLGDWKLHKSPAAFLSIGSPRDSVTALFEKEAEQ